MASPIATEDSFEKICHVLLPKQVTPFRIDFRNVRLAQVDNVRIEPLRYWWQRRPIP